MEKQLHSLTVITSGVLACCLLVVQLFPLLHDFPEWMYQSFLLSELLTNNSREISERFEILTVPVPNSISQFAMAALNLVVEPVTAGRLWLCCYFLFGGMLWWRVAQHRLADAGSLHLLLVMMLTLGPGFWNGYINFQVGLLLFGWYVYLAIFRRVNSFWVVLIFSVLIYFSHATVFAIFVFFVLTSVVFGNTKKSLYKLLALLPSLAMLCWYTLYLFSTASVASAPAMGISKWIQYKLYTLAKQGPFHNFIVYDGTSLLEDIDLIYRIGFVANFVFAGLLLIWIGWLVSQLPRAVGTSGGQTTVFRFDNSLYRWPIICTVAVSALFYLGGGANSFGVVNIGERFLVVGLMLLLMCFHCPLWLRKSLAGVGAVLALYTIVAIVQLSGKTLEDYAVERSASPDSLEQYVDKIYASTRHQYFNHRLYIYADRGAELAGGKPALLPIDLATSVVVPRD